MFWVVYLIMLSFTASHLSIAMAHEEESRKACKLFLFGVLLTAVICYFWHGFNEILTVLLSIVLPILASFLGRAAEKFK